MHIRITSDSRKQSSCARKLSCENRVFPTVRSCVYVYGINSRAEQPGKTESAGSRAV